MTGFQRDQNCEVYYKVFRKYHLKDTFCERKSKLIGIYSKIDAEGAKK